MENSYVGMSNCFYCNEPKEIILDRRLKNPLPQNAVYDKIPCDKCKGYMKQGIIFISVKAGSDKENPYRTGGWWVVKEDFVKRVIKGKMLRDVLKQRVCFIEDEVCEKIGLTKHKGGKNE